MINDKKFNLEKNFIILALALFCLSFGYVLGNNSASAATNYEQKLEVLKNASVQLDFSKLKLLNEVRSIIDTKYFSPKATPTVMTTELLDQGITTGYVNSYNDPYTKYFPPIEAKNFEQNVKGSFGGVGIEVAEKEGYIEVISPIKDGPAYKMGILAGDIIMSADGKDLANMSVEQAVSYIRGEIGTEVVLKVFNKSKKTLKEIKIKRDVIKIPTISGENKNGVYVIHLYNFSENSAQQFREQLILAIDSGNKKLLIDLRGNPGGYLESAVNMASFFIDEGKMVVQEKGNELYGVKEHRAKSLRIIDDTYKIGILIDEGSASASEILAGALQDHGKAKIFGRKSYGKGSVQEYINLENKGALKVTVANWLTPNGRNITSDKIVPDVILERNDKTTPESEMLDVVKLMNLN
jgi:carboxyl-terminal processing protease